MRDPFRRWSALALGVILFGAPLMAQTQIDAYPIRYNRDPGNISNSGLVYLDVAHEFGWDREAGLEFVNLGPGGNGGPQNIQIMVSGHSDVVYSHPTAVVNALKLGLKIKLILSLDGGQNFDEAHHPKPGSGLLFLRKANIKGPSDLVGKQVYVNTLGAAAHYSLKHWLRTANVPEKEVGFVVLPSATTVQALHQGQVDALWGVTNYSRMKELGDDPVIIPEDVIIGDRGGSGYAIRQDLIAARPDVVGKLTAVVVRTYDWKKSNLRAFKEVVAKIGQKEGFKINTDDFVWSSREHALTADDDIQFWIDELVIDKKIKTGQFVPSDISTNEFNPFFKK